MRHLRPLFFLIVIAVASPLSATNLIVNPSFAGNLTGWNPGLSTFDATQDATGVQGSGSARNAFAAQQNSTTLGIDQCIATGPGVYKLSAKVLIPSGQAVSGFGFVTVSWLSGTDCGTGLLDFKSLSTATTGSFVPLSGIFVGPPGTARAWVTGQNNAQAAGTHVVNWDDYVFERFPAEDFNGDGRSDVVLQNQSTGDVAEWLMDGNAIIAGAVISTPGANWRIIGTGDTNLDGNADIILQNSSTGDIAEWQMNGTTIVAGAIVAAPGMAWKVAAVADVNGDGKSDLILQNTSTSDIAVWLLNGSTITAGAIVGIPGISWKVIAAGDFNGDGAADLVLQNSATGEVAVWLLNTSMMINSGGLVASPGINWKVIGTGDLNLDGKADIVLQNTSTSDVAVWLMNGSSIATGAIVGSPGLSWTVLGMADFSGDGRADILLRDTSGAVAEWQMNGTIITSGVVVGSPGSAYVPIVK
jgi:FG-GAP-like repeat